MQATFLTIHSASGFDFRHFLIWAVTHKIIRISFACVCELEVDSQMDFCAHGGYSRPRVLLVGQGWDVARAFAIVAMISIARRRLWPHGGTKER